MHYEHAEGYPPFREFDEKGDRVGYGFFGYPTACLDAAMYRDDPVGFRFYFDRHFSLDTKTLGGSLALIAANKGAPKVVRELLGLGATDPAYGADELIARAQKVVDARERVPA